ncbi:MAG: hypothetical protein JXR44_05960 [Thiotrichales bacterium]|nr:hypothetical protein [Thiotrichales bacterium]
MRKWIFSSLFSATAVLMAPQVMAEKGVCEMVKPTVENIRANLHAQYLPNFIPVVVNSEKELGLSAEQCQAFNQFRKEKAVVGKELVEKINKMEQESHDLALNGASLDEIKARHTQIAEARAKLIEGKMKCHQFIKNTLTEAQYTQLVNDVYPKRRAMAMEKVNGK